MSDMTPVTDRLDKLIEIMSGPDFGKSSVGNAFPSIPSPAFPVATPSKLELAKRWLIDHPLDIDKAGRDLEKDAQPQGVKISYRTWNDAKKALGE